MRIVAPRNNLKDRVFGELTVLEYMYDGSSKWKCKCSCGSIVYHTTHELKDGRAKSCGHANKRRDLTGMHFGDWTVLEPGSLPRYWKCKCSCGKISEVMDYSLTSGASKGCGHFKDGSERSELKPGEVFNSWTVLEFLGNGKYLCRCQCGKTGIVNVSSLRYGYSKSCGCVGVLERKEKMLEKYGDITSNKLSSPRELWQIETLNNDEKFKEYVNNSTDKTVIGLSKLLGITRAVLLKKVKKCGLTDSIDWHRMTSQAEDEIYDVIKSVYDGQIIRNSRSIIPPYELDIFLPDLRLAVEFNGDYWNSDIFKSNNYHAQKTDMAIKKGIRIIHIFEYEWKNEDTREKIIFYLKNILNTGTRHRVYARNTIVSEIGSDICKEFLTKYHLQGEAASSINYGCFEDGKLIGVMTFGKPRFNDNYEYELMRLCWLPEYSVIGGAEKLLKHFIYKMNPKSIITYSNASKFTGDVYKRIGFNYIGMSSPNYIWTDGIKVLTRYQTQKSRLVELGLGTESESESDIMRKNGYFKLYDCGNFKYEMQL